MELGKVHEMLGKPVERGLRLGSFVVQHAPIVGPRVQEFLNQEHLLDQLLFREGVEHFEQLQAELEVAEVCGPEEEAKVLRRKTATLAAEVFSERDDAAEILPLLPEATEQPDE